MTENLHDRIISALLTLRCDLEEPCEECRILACQDAEAVIKALGLHEEELDGYVISNGLGQTIRRRKSRWRYVTEWETKE